MQTVKIAIKGPSMTKLEYKQSYKSHKVPFLGSNYMPISMFSVHSKCHGVNSLLPFIFALKKNKLEAPIQ